jgi:transposase-like protein
MSFGVIYGLYDPQDGALRYIGQTTRPLWQRLSGHVSSARANGHGRPRHVTHWVRSLLQEGLKPEIRVLHQAASQEQLDTLEVKAITDARALGFRLTNHDDGGRGAPGRKLSPEHNAKLHSPEVVARMAATRKGQPSPKKGATLSEETCERIRVSKLGNQCRLRQDVSTDAILQGIREGKSTTRIATEMGVERHTVLNRYKKAAQVGVPVPELNPTTFKHSEAAKRRIGQAQIGRKRSASSVAKTAAGNTKISTEMIVRRLAEGLSVSHLAQETGVDRSTIYLRLKRERVSCG